MMATLAQVATAEYYVMCQRSMRHPNEYYTGGAEPDGVWWDPGGLFGLKTGTTISTKDFYRLYEGRKTLSTQPGARSSVGAWSN